MSVAAVLLRWLHIVPAVAAGGATLFALIALLPTLDGMPEPARRELRAAVAARWRIPFVVCTTLLLLSGLANFVLFQAPVHRGQPVYHALFGIKFLAALAVFFLGAALTGRSPALENLRVRARFWTAVSAGLIVLILMISGVLRGIPQGS